MILHAVGLLLRNIVPALKVALVPMALFWLVTAALSGAMGMYGMGLWAMGFGGSGGLAGSVMGSSAGLIFGVLSLVFEAWIGVNWFRWIFREEQPGWLPAFDWSLISGYMWQLFLLGILFLVLQFLYDAAIVPLVPYDMLGPLGFVLDVVVVAGAMAWGRLRLSVVLPAAALGRPLTLADAWQETRPQRFALIGVAVAGALGSLALIVAPVLLPAGFGFVSLSLVSALSQMMSLAMVATLYGVAVEGRRLR
ncbi:hypothetical protein [Pseudoroseicyclus tamaricis]|nr:hypothetical protein [Pseudoroseicyclus tamaricis]